MDILSTVVAALYGGTDIRSLSRVARPSLIMSCIKRHTEGEKELSYSEIIAALQKDNFTQEALYLSNAAHLESAFWQIEQGKIITIACDAYPEHLLMTMGDSAPPIIWISDPALKALQPWKNNDGSSRICISAVGCRTPLSIGLAIAREVGLWTARQGYLAVSGGASGCDTAFGNAAFGAGNEVIHILPHGISKMPADMWGYAISVCSPKESFSTARAMERNSLIYSFSHMTVVCSARYRQGGSWLGASNAIKANRPVVVADWTSIGAASELADQGGTYGQAQRALTHLGARPMRLNIQSFRSEISECLDNELNWSLDKLAGNINSGLFESRS